MYFSTLPSLYLFRSENFRQSDNTQCRFYTHKQILYSFKKSVEIIFGNATAEPINSLTIRFQREEFRESCRFCKLITYSEFVMLIMFFPVEILDVEPLTQWASMMARQNKCHDAGHEQTVFGKFGNQLVFRQLRIILIQHLENPLGVNV